MDMLTMERWSPYVVGAAIGLLSCVAFALSNKPLGCSTSFATTWGVLARLIGGPKVAEHPYLKQVGVRVDWQWMLVAGVVAGSFLSAIASGVAGVSWTPAHWAAAFGDQLAPRLAVALAGGLLMGWGARWAGGCTSGHGISGSLQLAISGWVAVGAFFVAGIATAMLLFRVIGA